MSSIRDEVLNDIKAQPPTIIEAVTAIFGYFEKIGPPKLDPKNVLVVVGLREAPGEIHVSCVPIEVIKTMLEKPGGDRAMLPVLAGSHEELLDYHRQGATEGAIIWALDKEENYFMWAFAFVPVSGIYGMRKLSKGGES